MNTKPIRAVDVQAAIDELGDPKRAKSSARFFKTGPGEYGEGDVFAGVAVPAQRKLAKRFKGIGRPEVIRLLKSQVHEHRLTAVFLMQWEFSHPVDDADRQAWVDCYLEQVRRGRINNWDIVDSSASQILGESLVGQDYSLLVELAAEDDLWRRRVGIIATYAFLARGDGTPLREVAPLVIADNRDLIQKAYGWMLREMGKRCSPRELLAYLDDHASSMGRTALSYATEHLTKEQRAHYRSL